MKRKGMTKEEIKTLWRNCEAFLQKGTLMSILTDEEKELLCIIIKEEEKHESSKKIRES